MKNFNQYVNWSSTEFLGNFSERTASDQLSHEHSHINDRQKICHPRDFLVEKLRPACFPRGSSAQIRIHWHLPTVLRIRVHPLIIIHLRRLSIWLQGNVLRVLIRTRILAPGRVVGVLGGEGVLTESTVVRRRRDGVSVRARRCSCIQCRLMVIILKWSLVVREVRCEGIAIVVVGCHFGQRREARG